MKASFKAMCVLAVMALLAVAAAEAGPKKPYQKQSCSAGDRICPAGEGLWLCWHGNARCPGVRKKASPRDIPKCEPGEKLCQVSENDYICVPADQECPEPDLLLAARSKACPEDRN